LSALIPNDLGIAISPTHPVPGDPDYRSQDLFVTSQKAFTQEVRIQSNNLDSRLTWLAGVFYQSEHQSSNQYVPDTPAAFDQLVQIALGGTTQQIFGMGLADGSTVIDPSSIPSTSRSPASARQLQSRWRLTVTAGVRVQRSTFSFVNRSDGPFNGVSPWSLAMSRKPGDTEVWCFLPDHPENLVYATAAKGFRTGGANPAIPARCDADLASLGYTSAPDSYKSDSVWSYEVGSKNRLMGGRLRLESSIFDVKWSGIQQQVILGTGCGLTSWPT